MTSLGNKFRGNTTIVTFDEFERFIGVTALTTGNTNNPGSFNGCTNLTSIKFPHSIKSLQGKSFSNCKNLKIDVFIPNLESIGDGAFLNTPIKRVLNLGNITNIPGGSNIIDTGTFNGCTSLIEFVCPETVTSIGQNAFRGCKSLSSFNMPTALTKLAEEAFCNCTSLVIEDLSLPNLTSLGQNAFYRVKIKKISNLGNIKKLPTATPSTQNFGSKSVLEEFVIPSGVTILPSNTFYGYNVLASIHPEDSTSAFDLGDAIEIGENCFRNCTGLTGTPDLTKIEKIWNFAFEGAQNIAFGDLILPNLTTIGIRAFNLNGAGLRRILDLGQITTLPANNGTNVNGTFVSCSKLELAILPSTLTTMGTSWQPFINCHKLSTMIIRAETPPSLGSKFELGYHVSSSLKIYVPDASVEAYKSATNWASHASIIFPITQLVTDNAELYNEISQYL